MKKIYISVIITLIIGLVACNSNKKANNSSDFENGFETSLSDDSYDEEEDDVDEDEEWDDDEDEDDSIKSAESNQKNTEDWDAVLDAYENYVDKYIAVLKKVSKGDVSAMAEYSDLMQKSTEFSEKIAKAENDMSSSQISRYMKITNKMAKAAADLQ